MAGRGTLMFCIWNPNQTHLEGTTAKYKVSFARRLEQLYWWEWPKQRSVRYLPPTMAMTMGGCENKGGIYCNTNQFHFRGSLSCIQGSSQNSCAEDNTILNILRVLTRCCPPLSCIRGQMSKALRCRSVLLSRVFFPLPAPASVLCTERAWKGKKSWGKQLFSLWHKSYSQIHLTALGVCCHTNVFLSWLCLCTSHRKCIIRRIYYDVFAILSSAAYCRASFNGFPSCAAPAISVVSSSQRDVLRGNGFKTHASYEVVMQYS